MKDIQTHLNKIRSDAAECLVLGSLAPDGKREVFTRIAEHLNGLAVDLEKSIASIGSEGASGSKPESTANSNTPPVHHPQTTVQPRRLLPWLGIVAFGLICGAFTWANGPAQEYWAGISSKREPAPTSQQANSSQAIVTLISAEQAERKLLSEQVAALADRLDKIASTIDGLKKASDEASEPAVTKSTGAEAKPADTETSPPPTVEKPVSTAEIVLPAKQSDTIGPRGCIQFRSFDPKSGTYMTLDGRRRQCR